MCVKALISSHLSPVIRQPFYPVTMNSQIKSGTGPKPKPNPNPNPKWTEKTNPNSAPNLLTLILNLNYTRPKPKMHDPQKCLGLPSDLVRIVCA